MYLFGEVKGDECEIVGIKFKRDALHIPVGSLCQGRNYVIVVILLL